MYPHTTKILFLILCGCISSQKTTASAYEITEAHWRRCYTGDAIRSCESVVSLCQLYKKSSDDQYRESISRCTESGYQTLKESGTEDTLLCCGLHKAFVRSESTCKLELGREFELVAKGVGIELCNNLPRNEFKLQGVRVNYMKMSVRNYARGSVRQDNLQV